MAKILLTEDDKSLLNFLVLALGRAGHEITAKTNGQDALKLIESGEEFDLLLTDIVMPGIDGIELAQKATKKQPDLKIIFITGFAAITMNKPIEQNENAQLMSKPFHLNDLVESIDKLLSG